jgi:hypothetical protein
MLVWQIDQQVINVQQVRYSDIPIVKQMKFPACAGDLAVCLYT